MLKSYKVRLYPNKSQIEIIDKTIGCSRFIYNQMLEERISVYNKLKENKEELYKHRYKTEKEYKQEFEWLKDANSRALQQSRIDLQKAYKNFFNNIKKKRVVGFPKFKAKSKVKWSFREPQVGDSIKIENNKLKLLKTGFIKIKGLNKRTGVIKSVTVTKTRSNKYFASILVEIKDITKKRDNGVIGVDLGIKEFAIDSNGNLYKSISSVLFNKEKELKHMQKHFSRKQKDSKRRNKCRIKIARKYEQITNIRDYFHWHLVNKLCSENQTVVIENLQVANLIKNRKLSHSISYLGWSSFINKLKQKAIEYNTKIREADKYFASSKLCSNCGNKKDKLDLSERIYCCDNCGIEIDRDINSALNLKSLEYSDNSRGEIIRPKKLYFNFRGNFIEAITENVA